MRCSDCEATFYPGRDRCPRCGGLHIDPVELPPTGRVVARTQAGDQQLGEIELDGGVLVLARLVSDKAVGVGEHVRRIDGGPLRFSPQ